MTEEQRVQLIEQCKVVAHLARVLADVHDDFARMAANPKGIETLGEILGIRTANLMEILGDILSYMDAVTEDDKWTDSIFEKAHSMWKQDA